MWRLSWTYNWSFVRDLSEIVEFVCITEYYKTNKYVNVRTRVCGTNYKEHISPLHKIAYILEKTLFNLHIKLIFLYFC